MVLDFQIEIFLMSLSNIFILLLGPILVCSCMSYQYVALKSDLPVERSTMKYYTEHDSVRISYDFSGEGLPVVAAIYNYTSKDLYVDLKHSVYSVDGMVAQNAIGPITVQMHAVSNPDFFLFDNGSIQTHGHTSSTKPPEVLYIPSGMYGVVKSKPFSAPYVEARKDNDNTFRENVHEGGKLYNLKRYNFESDGRELGISFRISSNIDLSNARNITASFQEDYLYNSKFLMKELPNGMPKYFMTSKKHHVGAWVLVGALAVAGVYAIVNNEGE